MAQQGERPNDSGTYDDRTLLGIIAERFESDNDEVTRRDAAWLVEMAEVAVSRRRTGVRRVNCACRVPNCVCVMLVPHENLCDWCRANSHINVNLVHFRLNHEGTDSPLPCPEGCEDHV